VRARDACLVAAIAPEKFEPMHSHSSQPRKGGQALRHTGASYCSTEGQGQGPANGGV